MRVRDGDEASCLNLNRAQTPRACWGSTRTCSTRGTPSLSPPWRTKHWPSAPGPPCNAATNSRADEVPAIGDEASIQWALGKKIGDTLDYTDEHGNPFKVRIVGAVANSILQGSLLIDEAEFVKRFPGRKRLSHVSGGRAAPTTRRPWRRRWAGPCRIADWN